MFGFSRLFAAQTNRATNLFHLNCSFFASTSQRRKSYADLAVAESESVAEQEDVCEALEPALTDEQIAAANVV